MTPLVVTVRRTGGAVLVALTVLVLGGCSAGEAAPSSAGASGQSVADLPDLADCPAPTGRPALGEQTLPELRLPCLDGSGSELVVGEAPGRPMVLNLWASWCGPCRDELPDFDALYAAADASELLVIGVVTRDSPGLAAEFALDLELDFPSGLDEDGDLYAEQGLRGLPGTFFVTADGRVAHAELAPIPDYAALVALVQKHLAVSP